MIVWNLNIIIYFYILIFFKSKNFFRFSQLFINVRSILVKIQVEPKYMCPPPLKFQVGPWSLAPPPPPIPPPMDNINCIYTILFIICVNEFNKDNQYTYI